MNEPILKRVAGSVTQNGLRGTVEGAAKLSYRGLWYTLTSRHPVGTNIYEHEWEALIVLDACRVDALQEVADEFDFLTHVDSIWSTGSTSHEWMAKTFTKEYCDEIADTIYLTGNGFAQRTFIDDESPTSERNPAVFPAFSTVENDDFKLLKGVWQEAHNSHLGNVSPRYITDRAIELGRNESAKRLIIHYNQPHTPHLANAISTNSTPTATESDPFEALECRELQHDQAWNAYLDNLRLALHEVRLLLNNLDANPVVITADHGEAFGEWNQYGHPGATLNPVVKRVPWVVTTGADKGSHTPRMEPDRTESPTEIEDHLADLGYLD